MRVLQPGDTAGFAASQVTSNDFVSNSLSLKENGNVDFNSANGSSAHHSSADELIHSAFNSAEDKSIADYKANVNKNLHLYRNKNITEEDDLQITESSTDDENATNTYRSFEDFYHVNQSYFVECVKEYKHLEEIKPSIKRGSTESVIRNLVAAQEIHLNDSNNLDTSTSLHLGEVNKRYSEKNLPNCKGALLSKDDDSARKKDIDFFDEIDDGENSCFSISKRSHFLRGIINPNYPGFQHLAHTLTEHFIIHPSSETYDSDVSDCEMELSTDSFDNIQDDQSFPPENNNYNERAKKILSINGILNNNSEDEIEKLKDEDNTMDISNLNGKSFNDTNCPSLVVLSHDLPICLKSHLKLNDFYQDRNCSKFIGGNTNANYLSASGENSEIVATAFDTVEIDNNFGCPTPDILIKNGNLTNESEFKIQCRPDLLQNVNPKVIEGLDIKNQTVFGTTTEENQREVRQSNKIAYQKPFSINENNRFDQIIGTDEIAVGTTPVDIIGDFEQEVEREFGLLVNGYSRLVDAHCAVQSENSCTGLTSEKIVDAALSSGMEEIKSSSSLKIKNSQFLDGSGMGKINDYSNLRFPTCTVKTSQATKSSEVKKQISAKPNMGVQQLSNIFEDRAVNWNDCEDIEQFKPLNSEEQGSNDSVSNENLHTDVVILKPKYKKHSYDDRQLPPVAVDYKCSQTRIARKFQNSEKYVKGVKAKVARNNLESSASHKHFNAKRNTSSAGLQSGANRKKEDDEIQRYQQLISTDKELILSKSRYSKMSFWAQHLKNSVKERGNKKTSGLHQSKFSWSVHETVPPRIDMSVMANHLDATKDFEKKRRYDRDEIRKRLAMGFRPDTVNTNCHRSMQNGKILPLILMNDISSDNESHSSDSETCPKLSQVAQKKNSDFSNIFTAKSTPVRPYICRPLSVSCLDTKINELSNEDRECDFFAKQARLQIEARMALAQAKDMAHIQMEIDRQKQLSSPITDVIRGSLGKVGIQMSSEKRRVSRQMLTDMNIAQLQIIVNDLHTHIENWNESLVHYLMERDELHMGQDSMLIDIEDLTRYLGAKEQSLEQKRNLSIFKRQQ